jgi:hypothetical protein
MQTIATDTDTITIGTKVYTFKDTIATTDGHVHIGTDVATTLDNLYSAINLEGTVGTDYGTSMTANSFVKATATTATTIVVKALAPGTIGNGIATSDTCAGTSAWGATYLASGAGNVDAFITSLVAHSQINAEVGQALKLLTVAID